jgi:hypothetical protein
MALSLCCHTSFHFRLELIIVRESGPNGIAGRSTMAEFLLHILDDDVYVFPASHFLTHDTTTLSLNSSRVFDYKNAWCVLEGVDPTSWKEMREYRKRLAK